MQKVNIYVRTTAKGPAIRKHASYMYVIKMELNGKEYIRNGKATLENVTENQITLEAIIHALMRFHQSCEICIFTECEHVLNSCRNFWPQQWEKAGWVKSNGKEVKNKELWQQYLNVSRGHAISWSDQEHEFSKWMDYEFKKMEEADGRNKNTEQVKRA